jgi:hypothetical protein
LSFARILGYFLSMKLAIILSCLLVVTSARAAFASGRDSPVCASDIATLGSLFNMQSFPTSWTETTAADGNPLVMTVSQQNGGLFLQFMKTNAGLWASGTASICSQGGAVTASITKDQIKLGSAAPWVLRIALSNGATFSLDMTSDGLTISTTGWTSNFIPSSSY